MFSDHHTLSDTIQLLIWDWNGTLLDDAWLSVEILNKMRADAGLPAFTIEDHQRRFRFPISEYYREQGFEVGANYARMSDRFLGEYEERLAECQLAEGALQVLEAATNAGLRQVILSAYGQVSLEAAVERFGIRHHFERLVGRQDDTANGKIEEGRSLIAAVGIPAASSLLIGDSVHDLEVARDLGTSCLLVGGGHQHLDTLRATQNPTVASIADIPAWATIPA